ncbi:MAG: DUF3667 domain-containing protein [Bacteroidota bacterium]
MDKVDKEYPIHITQERTINRITLKETILDALSAFNLERGLLYTVKLLFSRPGHLIRSYLNEGRFQIFNVFRLLFLTTALSITLIYVSDFSEFLGGIEEGWNNYEYDEQASQKINDLQKVFFEWYNLLLWIAIPIYALFSFIFNRKSGYNYAEHMVMQSFYVSGMNIGYVVVLLLGLVITGTPGLSLTLLLFLVYYFWMLSSWLKDRRLVFVIKNILAFLLANIVYGIFMTVILVIIAFIAQ